MKAKELPHKEVHEENEVHNKKERFLLVHNDDYHTFDYVIDALMEICEHDLPQAEQCTLLIHFKGKCDVKKGSFSYLRPLKNALVQKDLKATIA
ncbi:MAG TPA: Clp protease ClpS [Prolixibacteraceae bacterium]|jgi:ATP-dependent Clp protease adaptor protein ClpS|nr:Clp protease ClpS [Prolixibacteraceae bacterium]